MNGTPGFEEGAAGPSLTHPRAIELGLSRHLSEQALNLPRENRFAEMVALHFIAIVFAQERNLRFCFGPLRDDLQIELLAQ